MHTELVHDHSASGMRFFSAVLLRQLFVHDFATGRAVANRRIGVAVIHIGAELRLHLDLPAYHAWFSVLSVYSRMAKR